MAWLVSASGSENRCQSTFPVAIISKNYSPFSKLTTTWTAVIEATDIFNDLEAGKHEFNFNIKKIAVLSHQLLLYLFFDFRHLGRHNTAH